MMENPHFDIANNHDLTLRFDRSPIGLAVHRDKHNFPAAQVILVFFLTWSHFMSANIFMVEAGTHLPRASLFFKSGKRQYVCSTRQPGFLFFKTPACKAD